MTQDTFQEWLDYHCCAFPGVTAWLAKHTPGNASDERKPAAHWMRALEDVSLSDAKRATDAMLAGDLDEPKGYSAHPRTIRRWCRTIAGGERRVGQEPEYVDGERVHRCQECQDNGTIPILHPDTITEARQTGDVQAFMACVVACRCSAGEKWSRSLRKANGDERDALPVIQPHMFRVSGAIVSDEEKQRFWEWFEGDGDRRVEHHANYHDEFAEFAQ